MIKIIVNDFCDRNATTKIKKQLRVICEFEFIE